MAPIYPMHRCSKLGLKITKISQCITIPERSALDNNFSEIELTLSLIKPIGRTGKSVIQGWIDQKSIEDEFSQCFTKQHKKQIVSMFLIIIFYLEAFCLE